MKSITINGSKESVGKNQQALRNADMVPCVLYGEKEPMHFAAKNLISANWCTTQCLIVIKTEDGEFNAVLQDIQFHPVSDRFCTLIFMNCRGKEISMNIPVVIEGAAPGVLNSGGTLILNKRKLRVRALPKNLPDFITADISGLELGNKLYTSQLPAEGFSFLHPDNTVVCQVKTSRASIKNAQTEGAEGEVEESEEAAE